MAFRSTLLAILFLSALTQVIGLKFVGSGKVTALASFGDASATVYVLTEDDGDVTVEDNPLFTVGDITKVAAENGYTNHTIPMTFDKGVGSGSYTVSKGSDSITGSVIVAGFVILDGGKIVSGENGDGISVGQSGSSTYDVKAVGIDGSEASLDGTTISARAVSGPYMKEKSEDTTITNKKFTMAINDLRVGTGNFVVDFETSSIELRGEAFETVLKVKQTTVPPPPCVAMGESITTKDGYVMVKMFNLLVPPQTTAVETVTITVGSESADWDKSKSTLTLPDQVVAFKISAGGKASIKCDGADAVIQGGDLMLSGDSSSPELAVSLISTLPDGDGSVLSATITEVDGSTTTTTKAFGEALLDRFCETVKGTACVITSIKDGSAIFECQARVATDQAATSKQALVDDFAEPGCNFQTSVGKACDKLTLDEDPSVNVQGAAPIASAAGLATWTIVLIAGLGAFALIALIMLGLLAVYRRSAEQSESDYSSSGPLGVPDPSDLLYEQSIVRDIYGRGDFPDGGPSAAVAEQREREANLREEYPRPPSSSGLSRQSAATDDASSTYSV